MCNDRNMHLSNGVKITSNELMVSLQKEFHFSSSAITFRTLWVTHNSFSLCPYCFSSAINPNVHALHSISLGKSQILLQYGLVCGA